VSAESSFNFEEKQKLESQKAGFSIQLIEMEKREQGYIHEIKTLEKHIDTLVVQLENLKREYHQAT
jgi:hypothetical protein